MWIYNNHKELKKEEEIKIKYLFKILINNLC